MELALRLTDTWTPEKRRSVVKDWQNDDSLSQLGHGQKRSIDEGNEGASTSYEVSDSNYFTVTHKKQVNVKKFKTTGVDYTVQILDTFGDLELYQFRNQLHAFFVVDEDRDRGACLKVGGPG